MPPLKYKTQSRYDFQKVTGPVNKTVLSSSHFSVCVYKYITKCKTNTERAPTPTHTD